MRALLGLVLTLVISSTAGCGDEQGGPGDDRADSPAPSSPSSPSTYPRGAKVPIDVVALVSNSNTRGPKASYDPVVLDDDGALEDYASRFQGAMEQDLVTAGERADVDADEALTATVIDVSCEAPSDVRVVRTFDGLQVRTTPVLSRRQCLVPVTTVALVVVPQAAL